jgi:type II secretory pathway pseudopilin PulG
MKHEKGYTLIELIVTITFTGIAFSGLIAFFTNIVHGSLENEIVSQAICLANEKMEEIYADRIDANRGIAYITTSGQYPSETIDYFTRTVTITSESIGGIAGYKIQVTVSHSLLAGLTLTLFTNSD